MIGAADPFLNFVEVQRDGVGGVDGLTGVYLVTVSPDGNHVYAASQDDDAVAVFSRASTTGALTFVEVHKDGVGGVDGLNDAFSVTVSPDGKHVYAAGHVSDAVAVFSRNSSTGALTFVEVQKDGVGGVDGLDGAISVTVSPDGKHLYVAGFFDDTVAVFSRDSTTGALTFVEFLRDGLGGVDGLDGARSVMVSPDGRHLYSIGRSDDSVSVFSRDSTTGTLTFVEFHKDGLGSIDGLGFVTSLAVSSDGKHLYATGGDDDAVAVFGRNSATGALTFVEVQTDGGGASVTVSRDGRHVYASNFSDDEVAVFSRDSTTGSLTFVEVQRDGVGGVDGLDGAHSVTLSPDGRHLYAGGQQDDAVAVFSVVPPPVLTFVEDRRDGVGGVDGLNAAVSVTVSPDGKHLYAIGQNDDAVAVFRRDSTTGALTFVEFHKDGVGGVDGLNGAISVTVSPDGRHLYAVAQIDDAVAVFGRSSTTGALTFVEFHKDGVGGVDGLNGAFSVAVSPDGKHLYATGATDDAVAAFSRDTTTGALTFVEFQKDDVGGVDGLDGATWVTVSPDGKHLYIAGVNDSAMAVLRRDSTTGVLTFVEVQRNGVGGVDGLNGANSVTVSLDGKHLYAAGSIDDAVAVFSRNTTTGALTFVEVQKDGVGGVDGLFGAWSVMVSPDGIHLVAAGLNDDAVAVFRRDSTTGALTFVEVHKDGVGGIDGLDSARSVAVSPDGKHVYAASSSDNAVAAFSVTSADLSITQFDSPDLVVVPGNSLTYTITVTNNGPDASTSVVLTDALPEGVTFSSASPGCNDSGGAVTCDIGVLPPNSSVMVTIAVAVGTSTTGMLINSAAVSGAETDPDTSNNFASAATFSSVTPVPSVSQWGLIGLATLMAASVLWRFRGRMTLLRR